MITLYAYQENGLVCLPWQAGDVFPPGVIWADAESPTPEDKHALQSALGLDLPTREDVAKNEMLSRLYRTDMAAYMTVAVINKLQAQHPETRPIAFVLTEQTLVTLRSIAPTSFKNFATEITTNRHTYTSGPEVLEGLLEEMVTRVGFNSERVVEELDTLSHSIFAAQTEGSSAPPLQETLRRLGSAADLNSKISESLYSFARLLAFFREEQGDNRYLLRKIDVIASDTRELLQQTTFLSDKITFLLDATLGMINVEQNTIMKILSVFTVIIMPPTLIGSIYGMNFADMPELHHPWGYPVALLTMAVCAVGPYLYFRRKGWL